MVLVVGLLEHDSGKTSVTSSLVAEARSRGIDAVGVKPVGGHSAWNQYETLERSIELGLLVGEDAYKLWRVSGAEEPIEVLSPLDMLTAPPDPESVGGPSGFLMVPDNILELAVLLRISRVERGGVVTKHYAVKRNLRRLSSKLRSRVEVLARKVGAEPVSRSELLELAVGAADAVDSALRYVARKHKLVIVESFNNAACPSPLCLQADKVILVAPGRAYVYDGRSYARAVRALASVKGLNVTTPEVVGKLKPLVSVELFPRTRETLDRPAADTERLLSIILGKALGVRTATT